MRIGIDSDGVLRDFIPDIINKIKETWKKIIKKNTISDDCSWFNN